MTAKFLLMFALPVLAFDLPDERDVDRVRSLAGLHSGAGESALLVACVFGYAACDVPSKANECAVELRKRYPSAPAVRLVDPGFTAMPCGDCCGLPSRCTRCEGKGALVMMAGSKPVRCVICSGSGFVKTCKTCGGKACNPVSKEACARLYRRIIEDFESMKLDGAGIAVEAKVYTEVLTTAVSLARVRMEDAIRIRGRVVQKLGVGALVRLVEKATKDGIKDSSELIFVAGAEALQTEALFTRIVYPDGTYDYETFAGTKHSVRAYTMSPWDGLLSPLKPEQRETIMGVPRRVYEKIRAKAQHEWPDDYGMQKYRIESEIKAYKELQGLN